MAKQMSFTCSSGIACPQSYWIPAQINLCKSNKTGVVLFYGYADKAARDLGKEPIGSKTYVVTIEVFDEMFAADAIDPEGSNQFLSAYRLAMSVLDVVVPASEGLPEAKKSFFDGALDV